MTDGGAEDFANADLLRPLLGHKGGKSEEPQTADKDGEGGEERGQAPDPLLKVEIPRIILAVKGIVEGRPGVVFFEDRRYDRERPCSAHARIDLDRDHIHPDI